MEKYLTIVEKLSSTAAEINEYRLKFFNSKVKIWKYADISQVNYQNPLQKIIFLSQNRIIRT